MEYFSTRDPDKNKISASKAIITGLAPDGGLYVPQSFPSFSDFKGRSYEEIAFEVLRLYLSDFSDEELKDYLHLAYHDRLPVRLHGNYLELYHGLTSAFKDVALQLYPHLLTASLRKNNIDKTAVVLVATSGDTGSAALAGLADVPDTKALIFYPIDGVSNFQKLQMTTQTGKNLSVYGIQSNFDEAQKQVKQVFTDEDFKAEFSDKYIFTSANSINLARLLPQIAYYFYAYSQSEINDKINFAVPTGNFGNILAGYYAAKMGLPINKLICATNTNRVLDDFFKTGTYDTNRQFYKTLSPSMDVLVSSNLERLTYDCASYELFVSDYASDEETLATIKKVYEEEKYIIDPHTAVAKCVYDKYYDQTKDETLTLIMATASPYKFPETIRTALGDVLKQAPTPLLDLDKKTVLHPGVTSDIRVTIKEVLS